MLRRRNTAHAVARAWDDSGWDSRPADLVHNRSVVVQLFGTRVLIRDPTVQSQNRPGFILGINGVESIEPSRLHCHAQRDFPGL